MKNALMIAIALMASTSAFGQPASWSEQCSVVLKNREILSFSRLSFNTGSIQQISLNGKALKGDAAYINMEDTDNESTPAGDLVNLISRKERTETPETIRENGYSKVLTKFDRFIRIHNINKDLSIKTGLIPQSQLVLKCRSLEIVPDSAQ
jgi:hypothetical protein